MRRCVNPARPDWQRRVETSGLVWHTLDAGPAYWTEDAHYRFSSAEIEMIERATGVLYELFIGVGDHILEHGLLDRFGIPAKFHRAIADAWDASPPALNYGRFDLGYDGRGEPKLFEFNCDTPTSLLEAAVIQWQWKEDLFPESDQFNSLHDKLVAKWRDIGPLLRPGPVHFAHALDTIGEDSVTVAYMRDVARTAGVDSAVVLVGDIGWDDDGRRFVDLDNLPIATVFHLYPWEWLTNERFADELIESLPVTTWIEPIWKMMWSNKAVLPLLWDLAPGHHNLLRAADAPFGDTYVRKPKLAREGANVQIVRGGAMVSQSAGTYASATTDVIYQELYDLPEIDGAYPVIGSWIVDGDPAGIGIREGGAITDNQARFVPHLIE